MFRSLRIMSTLASLMALGLMTQGGSGVPAPTGGTGTAPESGDTGGQGETRTGAESDSGETQRWSGDFDPARAQRALDAAREDARKAKEAEKATKGQLAAILKTLGLKEDGTEDPAEALKKATAERDAAAAKAKDQAVQLAVFRLASDPALGASPARLLDSRSFMAKMDSLNPDAADFGDKVKAAITEAIKADASLKAETKPKAPVASGGPSSMNGGSGTTRPAPLNAQQRLVNAYASTSNP